MNVLKKSLLASAVALASATAVAELGMTIGAVSDYVYRGSSLGNAGAYTSIDYGVGGFYAGVWAISDAYNEGGNDGSSNIEYDIYAGYDTEIAGVSLGLGYTAYEYTGTGDSESEFTLSAGMGPLSLSYSDGEDENPTSGDPDTDYDVLSFSADIGPFSLTYGEYDSEDNTSDYDWSEISTGTDVGALSLGLTLGSKSDGTDYLVLDMSTGIDL
jgi:uncharacterized protein (TIGR02001 family)